MSQFSRCGTSIVNAIDLPSGDQIGTPIDSVLLLCFHYDPATGKYGATAMTMVRVSAVVTMIVFAVFLTVTIRRERAGGRHEAATANRT